MRGCSYRRSRSGRGRLRVSRGDPTPLRWAASSTVRTARSDCPPRHGRSVRRSRCTLTACRARRRSVRGKPFPLRRRPWPERVRDTSDGDWSSLSGGEASPRREDQSSWESSVSTQAGRCSRTSFARPPKDRSGVGREDDESSRRERRHIIPCIRARARGRHRRRARPSVARR
jgi:hypothetical protein